MRLTFISCSGAGKGSGRRSSACTALKIATADRVALTAIRRVAGETGGRLLTAAILCSILGAMNALVLAGPRAADYSSGG